MKFLVILAIFAVSFGSSISFRLNSIGEVESDNRILGGSTAKRGQFPYMAAVIHFPQYEKHADFLFGGSIISDRWVVSCALELPELNNVSPLGNWNILVGGHSLAEGAMHAVNRTVKLPNRKKNDIALIQTYTTIEFNIKVQAIPLRKQFIGSAQATISGWGLIEKSPGDSDSLAWPLQLQFLQVKIMTNEECRNRHLKDFWSLITKDRMCAFAAKGRGVCDWDQGNPLVVNGQLVGVASWFVPCALGVPDGFTRISSYTDWIQEISGVAAV